jgi:DNA-binding GntR family transcriptional regulator
MDCIICTFSTIVSTHFSTVASSMPRSSSPPVAEPAPLLADRLLDLIARGDHPIGHRLTEQTLADALGVSRSPVRKALRYLEGLGAVGSNPNRGFFVAARAAALRRLKLPRNLDSDESAYLRIVEDRLSERLPEAVSDSELMQRYDLSRLQVQRILNRMAREGMTERNAGRGWTFRPVLNTVEAHRESYRFRMIIEPAALLEPTFRVDAAAFARVRHEQLQMLDGGIETWSPSERFRVGADFHETIVACSGNRFLLDALQNVNRLRRVVEYRLQTRSSVDRARLHRQCEEHLALLDLIESGDRMEAAHELRRHLDVVGALKTGTLAPRRNATGGPAGRSAGIEVHL